MNMDERIKRINELYHKSQSEGLTDEEKLEQSILSPKKLRRCKVCGTGILARSGRTKYCPACAKEVHRQQKAKSARKRRSGVDNLRAKSP